MTPISAEEGKTVASPPTLSLEVVPVPVSDIERALRFYVDQVGFKLDVDYSPNDRFRIVQLTPPGSSCSIQIGNALTDAPVGSLRNVYLAFLKNRHGRLPKGLATSGVSGRRIPNRSRRAARRTQPA